MMLTLTHFLVLSALVLAAGVTTMLIKRNAIGMLMGIELIVSAAMINFAAFNAYLPSGHNGPRLDGQIFTLFIMILAACQAAIAVAVFINLHQTTGSVDVEEAIETAGDPSPATPVVPKPAPAGPLDRPRG
jgi:NADH-quinone oxidoreductase subunit K